MKKLMIAISMFLMLIFSVVAVSAVNVETAEFGDDGASNPLHDDDDEEVVNATFTIETAYDANLKIKASDSKYDIGNPIIGIDKKVTNFQIPKNVDVIYSGDEDNVEPQLVAVVYNSATPSVILENITIQRPAKLVIDKVEATYGSDSSTMNEDSDEFEDLKPGTQMILEVIMDNDFDKDANNEIAVDVTIECDPNDIEIDDDSDDVDISEDDTDSVEFDLDFDEDDVEDTTYTCTIVASGNDENGAFHSATWDLDFTVEKEKYEVQIKELSTNPDSITCDSRDITVSAKIKNTGSKSDDEIKLEITVPKLNEKEEFVDIDLDETDDTRKQVMFSFPEDAEAGKYDIVAKTYIKGVSLSDTQTISVTVPECEENKQDDTPVVVTQPVVVTTPSDNEPVPAEPTTDDVDEVVEEDEEETSGNGMVIALVVLILLLIGGIVGLLIYLFKA